MFTFHHVGVATLEPDTAIESYDALGYRLVTRTDDTLLGVHVAILEAAHGPLIEIVAPLDETGGPLKSFIRRKQLPSPYHTCYAVTALEQAAEALRARGYFALSDAKPARVFGGARIQYQLHEAIGLVELIENPPAR